MSLTYTVSKDQVAPPPNDWDRKGLPAWAYANPELFELEKDVLFRRHWQLAGHVSDIPAPGSYQCLDIVGERAIVVRGQDNKVRGFHNVCRHRGSRVVADDQGACKSALVCPFHGWSYNLDGTFRSAPAKRTLPILDPIKHGLKPVETEIWMGFIFVRFLPGPQPSVAKLMEDCAHEVALYKPEEMAASSGIGSGSIPVNWKAVRDVDNEGYHVPIAHPALDDLYGKGYYDEQLPNGNSRSFGPFNSDTSRLWSVRNYRGLLPKVAHLPKSHQDAWLYLGFFPNTVLYFYPDSIGFYQEIPVGPRETMQRGADYVLPGACRELKAAHYLNRRINRDTMDEDIQLTIWSCEAAESSGYDGIILSDLEYGVWAHHDGLRQLMPVLKLEDEPVTGMLHTINKTMLDTS